MGFLQVTLTCNQAHAKIESDDKRRMRKGHLMVCMTDTETRRRVVRLVAERSPRPTELLQLLQDLSYSEVQDVIAELLDSGQIELDAERRLRTKKAAA